MMSIVWQAVASVVGIVFVGLVAWATMNFTRWTGIQLTQQQRDIINQAAEAIAGALKLMLAQGKLQLADLHSDNRDVIAVSTKHMTEDVLDALGAHKENATDLIRKAVSIVGHGDLRS